MVTGGGLGSNRYASDQGLVSQKSVESPPVNKKEKMVAKGQRIRQATKKRKCMWPVMLGRWPSSANEKCANTTVQPVTSCGVWGAAARCCFQEGDKDCRPWAAYILIQFERYRIVNNRKLCRKVEGRFLGETESLQQLRGLGVPPRDREERQVAGSE